MAAFVHMSCQSCGKTHDFCLPTKDEFEETQTYEYVCPEAGEPAHMTPGQKGITVRGCPNGSVTVKKQPLRE
jgi:hypothetical protein